MSLEKLIKKDFNEELISKRKLILMDEFSNEKNGKALMDLIFNKN